MNINIREVLLHFLGPVMVFFYKGGHVLSLRGTQMFNNKMSDVLDLLQNNVEGWGVNRVWMKQNCHELVITKVG